MYQNLWDVETTRLEEIDRYRREGPITSTEHPGPLESMGASKSHSVSGLGKETILFFMADISDSVVEYIQGRKSSCTELNELNCTEALVPVSRNEMIELFRQICE